MGSTLRIAAWVIALAIVLAVSACVISSIHSAIRGLREEQRHNDASVRTVQVELPKGSEAKARQRLHGVNAAALNARRT